MMGEMYEISMGKMRDGIKLHTTVHTTLHLTV